MANQLTLEQEKKNTGVDCNGVVSLVPSGNHRPEIIVTAEPTNAPTENQQSPAHVSTLFSSFLSKKLRLKTLLAGKFWRAESAGDAVKVAVALGLDGPVDGARDCVDQAANHEPAFDFNPCRGSRGSALPAHVLRLDQ